MLTEFEEKKLAEYEAVYQMLQSDGWKVYSKELESVVESHRKALETCQIEEVVKIRGQLEGVREVLRRTNYFIAKREEFKEKAKDD